MRSRWIIYTGYGLSAAAVVMRATEHVLASHRAVLLMTMIDFAALTAAATIQLVRSRESTRDLTRRLLAAMAVFLFAVSLVHVDAGEAHEAWSMELLAHHAGVPLALVILLQDFRFVLLDAFVRVLAGILLAAFVMALASPWVVVPLRLGPGDTRFLLLGRRSGGRRYLSEDLQAAERLASQLVAHVEHFREAEMRQLVAQAEDTCLVKITWYC